MGCRVLQSSKNAVAYHPRYFPDDNLPYRSRGSPGSAKRGKQL